MRSNFLSISNVFSTNKISVCLGLEHKSPRFVSSIAKYKAHSHICTVQLLVCAMIEQLQYVAKEYGEKRAKEAMKKSSRSKQFPNSTQKSSPYTRILETRLRF